MSLQPPESSGANESRRQDDLKIWNCVNCRRRKVRCDRRHPCSPCTKNKTECVFPVSGRIPSRSRDTNHPRPPAQKQAELLGRLRRLEAMVGDLGSQVECAAVLNQGNHQVERSMGARSGETSGGLHFGNQATDGNPPTISSGTQAGFGMPMSTSDLLHVSDELEVASNGDITIGDRFWTVFCQEVEQIFETVNGPTATHFDGHGNPSSTSIHGNHRHGGFYNFLLKNTSASQQREDLYPLPSQILFLWQIYMDNIDPFMKVLHVPTMTKVIRELKGSYKSLGCNMQALVLAISFAAITSLGNEEVQLNFNNSKSLLAARFRLGTEQAFEQADFLNNPDMIAVQAFIIYLGILQHTGEMKSAWILTGLLVRLATSIKLHRDSSHLATITPFEVEMRRRLWWQICLIDSRSEDTQVSAYKLSSGMFDTERPSNIDDADLDPGMSRPPISAERWTDMTVFLIRCEVWMLSHQLQSIPATNYTLHSDSDTRLDLFQQSKVRIESTCLKHLDPNQPLHSFVATNTQLFLTKLDLILHAQQHSTGTTEPQPLDTLKSNKEFASSLSIIEYTYSLQNEPSWSNWRWQIQGRQPPWYALRVVLSELCTHNWEPICERAWLSTKRSLDTLSEALRRDAPYQQLLRLVSAVERRRSDELQHQNFGMSTDGSVSVTSVATSSLSASFAGVEIDGTVSPWPSHGLALDMGDGSNSLDLSDGLGLDMEWQAWDDIAGDLNPFLDFGDINDF